MTTRQSAQKAAATRRRQKWYSERLERVEPEQEPAPLAHAIAGVRTVCGISLLGADSSDGVYVRPLVTCPDCLR